MEPKQFHSHIIRDSPVRRCSRWPCWSPAGTDSAPHWNEPSSRSAASFPSRDRWRPRTSSLELGNKPGGQEQTGLTFTRPPPPHTGGRVRPSGLSADLPPTCRRCWSPASVSSFLRQTGRTASLWGWAGWPRRLRQRKVWILTPLEAELMSGSRWRLSVLGYRTNHEAAEDIMDFKSILTC